MTYTEAKIKETNEILEFLGHYENATTDEVNAHLGVVPGNTTWTVKNGQLYFSIKYDCSHDGDCCGCLHAQRGFLSLVEGDEWFVRATRFYNV